MIPHHWQARPGQGHVQLEGTAQHKVSEQGSGAGLLGPCMESAAQGGPAAGRGAGDPGTLGP